MYRGLPRITNVRPDLSALEVACDRQLMTRVARWP